MQDQVCCKHHQYGHCKFGETCRLFHTPHTCSNPTQCKITSCTARHPKPCRYFVGFGVCKFDSKCSFFHPKDVSKHSDNVDDVNKLKENLHQVLESLKSKESEIRKLEERILELEEKHQPHYSCGECGVLFSSYSFLKSHIQRVHEKNKNECVVQPQHFCDACRKHFKSTATLQTHMMKFHKEESFKRDTFDNDPVACSLSPKSKHPSLPHSPNSSTNTPPPLQPFIPPVPVQSTYKECFFCDRRAIFVWTGNSNMFCCEPCHVTNEFEGQVTPLGS